MPGAYGSLNFGSQAALEPAEAAPLGQNPMPQAQAQAQAAPLSAAPAAPPVPSQTAPIRQDYEESMTNKIGMALLGLGTKPGEIPVPFKMRIAQQEAQLKASEDKLAWENHFDKKLLHQQALQQQNRQAFAQGMELFPHLKSQIMSIQPGPTRDAFVASAMRSMEGFAPGFGAVVEDFAKDPSSHYALDAFMNHRDPDMRAKFQAIAGRKGYDQYMLDPEAKALAQVAMRDWSEAAVNYFNTEERTELVEGKMTETRFREVFKNRTLTAQMNPQEQLAARSWLDSAPGKEFMAGHKVQLDKVELAQDMKAKPEGEKTVKQLAEREVYDNAQAVLKKEKDKPGSVAPNDLKEAKADIERLAKTQSPEASPVASPNNPVNQEILKIAPPGSGIRTSDDLLKDPKNYARDLDIMKRAVDAAAARIPKATSEAREGEQADLTGKDIYSTEAALQGKLVPLTGEVSKRELKKGLKGFNMSGKDVGEWRKSITTQEAAKELFALAKKAFPAGYSVTGASSAESALKLGGAAGAAARTLNPEYGEYFDKRGSILGTFARSVSGEMGVLTDQDIARVEGLFPKPGDSQRVILAKEASIKKLIEISRQFMLEVNAGGIVDPAQIEALKRSPKWRDLKEGAVFGHAKGAEIESAKKNPSAPVESLVPQKGKSKMPDDVWSRAKQKALGE